MKSLSLEHPHAIVMVGIPGSGKTFFASKFAETFHAPYLDHAIYARLTADAHLRDMLVSHFIHEVTKTNQSVVLEIDTATRTRRTDLTKLLKKLGYVPLFVWVQIDSDTARQRSLKSNNMSAEAYASRLRSFSPPHQTEHATVISGKHTYASQAKIVLKKLSTPRAEPPAIQPRPTRGTIIVR